MTKDPVVVGRLFVQFSARRAAMQQTICCSVVKYMGWQNICFDLLGPPIFCVLLPPACSSATYYVLRIRWYTDGGRVWPAAKRYCWRSKKALAAFFVKAAHKYCSCRARGRLLLIYLSTYTGYTTGFFIIIAKDVVDKSYQAYLLKFKIS